MYTESQRRGAGELLSMVNQIEPDVVRGLIKTCTEDRVSADSVETLAERIHIIIEYTGSPRNLLIKKKLKVVYLEAYLHAHAVVIPPGSTKPIIEDLVLDVWNAADAGKFLLRQALACH